MVDKRPHAVYRRLMISHGHGYPFWVPEIDQSLPLQYRQNGVKQGDLIILNGDGGYSYLFNVEAPAEDPVNSNRVPLDFEPLHVESPPRMFPLFHNKGSVVTAFDEFTRSFDIEASAELPTLAGAGVSFGISTSKAEEAILMLPDGATRYDASKERIYEEYAEKYAESWFDFVENELGKRLPTSSLYLVTGCDKSPSWGAAVLHNPTDSGHCSLNFTVGGIAGGGISYSMSEKKQRGPNVRSFPPTGLSPSDPVLENQCVFARGLTITIRRSFLKSKVSGVEVSWIDGSSNDTCPSFRSGNSPRSSSSRSPASWLSRRSDSGSPPSSSKRTASTGHTDSEDLSIHSDASSDPTSDEIPPSGPQMNSEWSWNPSTCLSQWMLSKCPNANISIVSDREWMSYVRDTPAWTTEAIVNNIVARRDLTTANDIATFIDKKNIVGLLNSPISDDNVDVAEYADADTGQAAPTSGEPVFAVQGLEPAIALLANANKAVINVKLHRNQCEDIILRCVGLMVSLRDSKWPMELVDEINDVAERINKRVTEWAALSRLRSFIFQREIKEGIDKLQRDIDAAVLRFNMQLNLEIVRFQQEAKDRDRAEMRELLEKILLSNDDRRMLVNAEEPGDLHEVMQVLQKELRKSESLQPKQEENSREGLWWLLDQTAKLPPLTDLSGQVTMDHDQAKVQGTFNDIFLGQWLDHEPVALRLPRALTNSPDNRRRFQREVKVWRTLERHPNVVPLYGLAYIESEVYLVSPWMDNGTAVSFVQRCPSADRLKMLTEIATGLEYLHSHGVIHGDLRGANVLIDREQIAKISDFGLSKVMEECGEDMTISPARWAAPELFRTGGSYSTQSDVWSFGMVMYELLTGKVPFHSDAKGKLPEKVAVSQEHWEELWVVMKGCWRKKPSARPSMNVLKNKMLEIRGLSAAVRKSRLPLITFGVTR